MPIFFKKFIQHHPATYKLPSQKSDIYILISTKRGGYLPKSASLLPSPKLIITLQNQGYMAVLKAKLEEIKQYSAQYPALIPV